MLIVCKLQICNCKSSWKASSNQRGHNLARNHSELSSFQVIHVHAHENRDSLTWCISVSLRASLDKLWLTDLYFRWGEEVLMPFHKDSRKHPVLELCQLTFQRNFRERHPKEKRRENLKEGARESEILCLVFQVWWFRWGADTMIQEIPLPPPFHTCKMLLKVWTCSTALSTLQKKHFWKKISTCLNPIKSLLHWF